MEGNVLVELNDTVQGSLTGQRNKSPADGKQNHGNVEMQDQRRGSGNLVGKPEEISRTVQIVFKLEVHEAESEDHSMESRENEDEAEELVFAMRGEPHGIERIGKHTIFDIPH